MLMFSVLKCQVDRQCLPRNKVRPVTAEDIALRRQMIRQRHAELVQQQLQVQPQLAPQEQQDKQQQQQQQQQQQAEEQAAEKEESHAFIAFARVFSGQLRKGQQLYVLGPKYDPSSLTSNDIDDSLTLKVICFIWLCSGHSSSTVLCFQDLKDGQHVTRATVGDLYMLMGRELEALESVSAGNVVGIGGLEEHIVKSATLSSTLHCPPFCEMTQMAVPIVRVAVEPSKHSQMNSLLVGLKLLNQADPCVQVSESKLLSATEGRSFND